MENLKLIFLGTSDAIPSAKRNHTSIFLSYGEENILVDCGEGTQRQLRIAEINPCKITKILITHWHGDHVLGLPGLFETLAFSGYNKTLEIYGPKGTKKFISEILKVFGFYKELKMKVSEVEQRIFVDEKDFYIESEKMTHGTPCNAYNFVIKNKIRIHKDKLKKYKIPEGAHLSQLKDGKDLTFNGKKFRAKDLTYIEEGKKISFILDTSFNDKISPFIKNADIVVMESSFSDDLKEKAKEYKHLTSKQVGEIAKKAGIKKLFLTHISQRYDRNNEKILKEVKKNFKNSYLARDFDVVDVR